MIGTRLASSALSLLAAVLPPLPPGDALETVLARPSLQGARLAVAVVDATTGESLFARGLDLPMVPASNLKLLTTAAAVSRLGPDFLIVTRLFATEGPDAQGVVTGDLLVVGGGDPCLRTDALAGQGIADPAAHLAGLLVDAGVTRIEGALVLDDGYFDREWVHPAWEAADLDKSWSPPVSALSLHGNCLTVEVDGRTGSAPQVALQTVTEGYTLRNELEWASSAETFLAGALRPDPAGLVWVRGRVSRGLGVRTLSVPVRDPALLFGRCLKRHLDERGLLPRRGLVRDGGAVRSLARGTELVRLQTPLALAVLLANKESDNSVADHLFKILGAEAEGEGSFAGGGRAVLRFLDEVVGTPVEGLVVQDGSGLAGTNLVTARALVDTLVAMNRSPSPARDLFLRTLPVSGLDGTLHERLTSAPYRGAVRAKTGYIQGVSALSGYVHAGSGRLLAFAILINDVPPNLSNRDMKRIQDDVCRALVDRG